MEQRQHLRLPAACPAHRSAWFGAVLLSAALPVYAASTLVSTRSYDYDPATGRLVKTVAEPGDAQLCVVTELGYDAHGHNHRSTVRNCNGTAGATPGAGSEAPAPAAGSPAVIAPRITQAGYSADQRFVTDITNAVNDVQVRGHDVRFGTLNRLQEVNGAATTWQHDALGRRTLEIRADGTRVRWDYVYCNNLPNGALAPPAGAATAACDPVPADPSLAIQAGTMVPVYYVQTTPLQADGRSVNGPYTRVYFDALEREIRNETQGFDGASRSRLIRQDSRYDLAGRLSARSLPYFGTAATDWVTYTYDALGRRTSTTEPRPDGLATTRIDHDGLEIRRTDPLGHVTLTTSDVAGRIVKTTDAKGGTLQHWHDPAGRLVQSRDALGNTVSITYDLRGRKAALYDPDLGLWQYAWNVAGDLVRQTDARGQATLLAHDSLGRVVRRAGPDMTSNWHYGRHADGSPCPNGAGLLCEAVADNGYRRRHAYDAAGRPASTRVTVGAAEYTAAAAYDPASGRLVTQTYPSQLQVRHGYTGLGYLKELTDGRTGQPLWQVTGRDAQGLALQTVHGNGVTTDNAWYADGSLNATQANGPSGAVQNLTYTYDRNGNPVTRVDALAGVTARYVHDELDRLTQETRWGGGLAATEVTGWGFDAIGNLASRSEGGQTHTYLYNSSGVGSRRPHAVAGCAARSTGSRTRAIGTTTTATSPRVPAGCWGGRRTTQCSRCRRAGRSWSSCTTPISSACGSGAGRARCCRPRRCT